MVRGLWGSKTLTRQAYASWGPVFWPFLRSSARAPTIKAVRGTVAMKGVLDNYPFPSQSHRFPSVPLVASFNCSIVGRGLKAFNCQGSGVSPGHPTRQRTGASQKMDRSKKGLPEVPHREGALGDLCWTSGGPLGTDFEGVLGGELFYLRGFLGDLRGSGGGVWRGTSEAYFGRGPDFGRRMAWVSHLMGISTPKKIFSPPPLKIPADSLPAPRPPAPSRVGDPPSWDFQ